ncbi:efflux RND transporter periplasmic adaptor subunit [Ancylomarina euxinus]|uniref:Efflux RND transporter periplasmic adaptor subunit n=1 Tax=Ancylomarina euxinus TaxID=2283627 RepID=A0A425Y2W9_9BACT|nr:efflux RND transporter periplasmic adaptor subunit [Ancylomarina euxinus]MCZ4694956.1 efflux RND transporter periplasmic adaptor subunit [Ancylomarina euxinus]MUP14822.1 efflux RND transporter periplasmic adaptor subunit [Ancylomarina euxinus]RRG22166.1 efflux RND transporter periplasmic adaptor subunit [Ancylomarina euxinus]
MKEIINSLKQNIKLIAVILVIGSIVGFVIGKSTNHASTSLSNHDVSESSHQHINTSSHPKIWTCSMHPQIKQDKPGLCPICAMDLIPLKSMQSGGDDVDSNEIVMSESAAKLASIQTIRVEKGTPIKTINLQGKVQVDERNISELTARFGGRIEKLFVNYTGQYVRKGEKLASIYSPALLSAQKELLEAISFKESRPGLYTAAKGKLKLWDLTDKQIAAIEENGEPQAYFNILSPITGTVSMRHVALGDYVKEGKALFKVVDLSKVWVMFDAYESDLPWIKLGDKVSFYLKSLPGKSYTAKVTYIDPFINGKTRVAKVRLEVTNKEQVLKPEMFAQGILESEIAESSSVIMVPKSAVLWTGKRSVVYVKIADRESPSFLYREVVLGPEASAYYVISEGLEEGEEIATNGVFKIDAAAQLVGLRSMMNPAGGAAPAGHNHGGETKKMMSGLDEAKFFVNGACEMCKENIEMAAYGVKGVAHAVWDKEAKELTMHYDAKKVNPEKVQKAITEKGYDAGALRADDKVYTELPECCQYSRMEKASVWVNGNCDMCKAIIEEAAMSTEGVVRADWNGETHTLNLDFELGSNNVDAVEKAIAAVGYDTKNHKASDSIYQKLPDCCQYDRK